MSERWRADGTVKAADWLLTDRRLCRVRPQLRVSLELPLRRCGIKGESAITFYRAATESRKELQGVAGSE